MEATWQEGAVRWTLVIDEPAHALRLAVAGIVAGAPESPARVRAFELLQAGGPESEDMETAVLLALTRGLRGEA